MKFEHVLVVGAGQMGGGIAQVVAASGRRVSLYDSVPGATERGLAAMRKSLERLAEKGGADPDEVLGRVEAVDDLVPADLMVEAVVEDLSVKEDVFRRADGVLPPDSVLASNTSSIPIGTLAEATGRPDRVIGMHFFNPVPVLQLVEIVRGRQTSDETAEAITDLARELGKTPAVANDFPGFVSNRILMPFINEAVWALHDGVAEAEAIDTIAKLGFAHPMGPLALADLIGLDTCVAIMEVLEAGLNDDEVRAVPASPPARRRGQARPEVRRGLLPLRLKRVPHEPLEVGDQPLALRHQPAVLHEPGAHPALHRLDQHAVLGPDLAVEGDQLLLLRLADVRPEEVVEEAGRAFGPVGQRRADREVDRPRKDVDARVRPEEVELARAVAVPRPRMLAGRPASPSAARTGRG